MLVENTASGMGHFDDPREYPATAQESYRTESRARSRWTDAATLVPLVTSSFALLLSAYAVFSQVRPALPIPAAAGTEASVARAMPPIGSTGRISAAATACFELQDFRKARDRRASHPGAADQHASQACGTFDAGLSVTIDKASEADSAVCARQVGLALCFWIASEAFAAGS